MLKNTKLKITCSNLRGLNTGPKLAFKMQHLLRNLNSDIQIVVNSHCDDHTLNILKKEYKLELAQFNIDGNLVKNRGILVLTRKNSGYISKNFKIIDKDNAIQFDILSPDNTTYNIVAIYAPNSIQDNLKFFKSLPGMIKKEEDDFQILIGDYNTTLDPKLDKVNYKGDDHAKSREVINSWLMDEDFIDSYRYIYPDERNYSYRQDCDKTQKARLDYALVSPNLIDKISQVEHCFTNASDHATVSIEISTDMEKQGQGIFRAPPYIQNDPKYVKLAEEVITHMQKR